MADTTPPVHPDRLDLRSLEIADARRQELLRLFPEARTEGGKIDFAQLQRALGETIDPGKERYGMNWPGKADCFKTIQAPSTATLRPCPEESVNFGTTENLIIEGDNLEVLKLLQKSYLGKVKMIYIDPPYNTGNDFIYPDNYAEGLQTYLEYTKQTDAGGRKYGTNTETDGRFHSKWLSMMYPRLYLARNLLKEDGVIWVSIDDHEVHALKEAMNQVFGEDQFLGHITWQRAYSPVNLKQTFSENHDFLLCYAKSGAVQSLRGLPRPAEADARYTNPDNDPRGPWKSSDLSVGPPVQANIYPITLPSGRSVNPPSGYSWRLNPSRFAEYLADNRISFGPKGDAVPSIKRFLSEVKDRITPLTIWLRDDVGDSQEATRDLKNLFDDLSVIEYPKPVRYLSRMVDLVCDKEDVVLDFFAGSGTTAHAVLEMNRQDGGDRKFVLVQLPEPTGRKDYPTIADVTKDRVRRAIKKLNAEDEGKLPAAGASEPDRGFRVFKLAESNFTPWNADAPKDAAKLAEQLELHVDHVREGRTEQDLLYEVLLKSGYPLTVPVETLTLGGKKVFSIAGGLMLACFDKELTLEAVRAMGDIKPAPERIVCLDAGFKGNDQLKTNAVQIFKTKGVSSFKTV